MIQRIRAAIKAKDDAGIERVIGASTDARSVKGFEECLKRTIITPRLELIIFMLRHLKKSAR